MQEEGSKQRKCICAKVLRLCRKEQQHSQRGWSSGSKEEGVEARAGGLAAIVKMLVFTLKEMESGRFREGQLHVVTYSPRAQQSSLDGRWKWGLLRSSWQFSRGR